MTSTNEVAKLTYFRGRGLGEKIRWMLAAANVDFEQVAFTKRSEFVELRDTGALLFNQMPLLEIDGLQLTQHRAVYRYLAERGKLYGETAASRATCDMLCEFLHDLNCTGFPFSADKDAYRETMKKSLETKLPILERFLGNDKVWPRGADVTSDTLLAPDVIMSEVLTGFQEILGTDCLDAYPLTKQVVESVREIPRIKAYLESDKRFPAPLGTVGEEYVHEVNTVLGR